MKVWFAGGGTGGHLYPALAIARAMVRHAERSSPQRSLPQRGRSIEPFFIGAHRGIEREILPTTEFPYELLDLHPLYRRQPWKNWRTAVGGLHAWRRLRALDHQERPAVLVATGGYVAGVALQFAAARRIPIIIQEQNSYPGATVRWFAAKAAQIHLGFPEARSALRLGVRTAVFDSGNPIEPPPTPFPDRNDAARAWGFPPSSDNAKTVLVYGGSQGARAINAAVSGWLQAGGATQAGVRILWSTGNGEYDQYASLASPTVAIRPYIAPMRDAYAVADLAVCRAGAMATAELAAWGIPALLIPLPTAAADHQTANAAAIARAGAGEMLRQSELTKTSLASTIREICGDENRLHQMRDAAFRRARPHAADDIAQHILSKY